MPLNKQDRAAIVTIRPSMLKGLDLKIGADLRVDSRYGELVKVPAKPVKRMRHTLAQLLEGATPKAIKALNDDAGLSREGYAVGRELA